MTPDVAIEQGATEFFPDGEMLTTRSKYLVAHLKKDGKWKMISARSMGEEVVSNYEFLRRLKFLVGEWVDEDPDSVVESKFYWDEGQELPDPRLQRPPRQRRRSRRGLSGSAGIPRRNESAAGCSTARAASAKHHGK